MTTRVIQTEPGRADLIKLLTSRDLPFTVNITNGVHRTSEQNRLQRLWINEIAEQRDEHKAEYWRGYCKLRFGVPIMRAANEIFMEKYDRLIKPRPYEEKIELMMEPMDFPVTRLMNTKQKTEYLDEIGKHFAEQGVVLTQPQRG